MLDDNFLVIVVVVAVVHLVMVVFFDDDGVGEDGTQRTSKQSSRPEREQAAS
jgi:hypothetical protein